MLDWAIYILIGLIVLGLIFGKKKPARSKRAGRVGKKTKLADVAERAFDEIMADIDMPRSARRRAKQAYLAARKSGSPRSERDALFDALSESDWGDRYFAKWRREFSKGGAFPYMWQKHPDLCFEAPSPPSSAEEAIALLKVEDMRTLAVGLEVTPTVKRPRRRKEFVSLMSDGVRESELVRAAGPRHEERLARHAESREVAKCEILAHTIAAKASSMERSVRTRSMAKWKPRLLEPGCPVEAAYARRFRFGDPSRMPPFFPGDRNTMIWEPPN